MPRRRWSSYFAKENVLPELTYTFIAEHCSELGAGEHLALPERVVSSCGGQLSGRAAKSFLAWLYQRMPETGRRHRAFMSSRAG